MKKSPTRLLLMFALSLFGLMISGYLAFAYLKVTDLSCTDNGCDVIRDWHDQRLPRAALPLLGSLYFLGLAALTYLSGSATEAKGKKLSQVMMGMGALGSVAVLGLTSIEVSLRAYCFWCMMVAGTTLAFLVLSVLEWRSWAKGNAGYSLDFEPFMKWAVAPVILVLIMVSSLEKSSAAPGDSPPPVSGGNTGTTSGGNTPPGGGNSIMLNPTGTPNAAPTPTSLDEKTLEQRLKEVTLIPKGAHSKGPDSAPVTLVEFADPGCMACANQAPVLDALLKAYPNQVRLVQRHFPLRTHVHSKLSAEAIEAAGAQGKFWEMRDILFRNLGSQEESDLINYARQLGLNVNRFKQDLESHKYAPVVASGRATGDRLGIRSTPSFVVNGKRVVAGPLRLDALTTIVNDELQKAKTARAKS